MSTNIVEKIGEFFQKKIVLEPRTVYFNQELPESDVDQKTHRPLKRFDKNEIRTTKYTPFSFIPKNLLFQFQNIANVYFLFLIILGAFQIFGVSSPGLAAVPLIVIVIITAIKDAFEDSRRTISDLELNNTPVSVLQGIRNHNIDETNISLRSKFNNFNSALFVKTINFFSKLFHRKSSIVLNSSSSKARVSLETVNSAIRGSLSNRPSLAINGVAEEIRHDLEKSVTNSPTKFVKDFWKNVRVGDIVRIHNNEEAPADIIILSSSDQENRCFIETKNLDGETNLKSRRGLKITSAIRRSRDFLNYKFKIESEAPSLSLYTYRGSLSSTNLADKSTDAQESVSIENLLLRGSTLRNTKWVMGIVVFTGHESKIMLNSGKTPSKRSRITKDLNLSVIINFVFLFVLCLVSGIVNGVFYDKKNTSFKLYEYKAYGSTPAINGIIAFFVAVILYQSLVPISLYISVEIVKTLQALFIYSDVKMYYEKLDYPCTPKSWNISDDLGQIEYIFSDKTGTLTQNVMEFKKVTVNGKSYGLAYTEAHMGVDKRNGLDITTQAEIWTKRIDADKKEMIAELSKVANPHFDEQKLTFISSEFVKDSAGDSIQSNANNKFMLCLSLCHTVLTEPLKSGSPNFEFRAESPDELALVQAASDVGYTFMKRTSKGGILSIRGKEREFEILKILEFNSTRKRMSVIVKIDDKIHLICKGADSVIYGRLDNSNDRSILINTANQLEQFAFEGLRTLCIASREISIEEYTKWEAKYDVALSSLVDRELRVEALASEIESNLFLLGGTAIEDRLQEGVPESIDLLGRAGIKLWVLTGDKIETAINIGFSCNLLSNNMELLVVRHDDDENLNLKDDIEAKLLEYLKKFEITGSLEELKKAKTNHSRPNSGFAVIVDGASLTTIFQDIALQRKFLLLCKECGSVLCCRVSPAQKSQVVRLVRDSLDVMTLAIGDGANDVSMIQTANVGVGIIGEEGRQAAMASDYAIGQFRFLTRLILVHGRWSYKRLAEMIPSFFYKNVTFTLTLLWYGIYNNFDGSYLFEYTIIMFFNLAFTSLPIIFLGVLDQDVSDVVSLKVPQLYTTGILRQEWSQWKFIYYMIDGLYQSIISFFMPYCLFFSGILATYNGLNIDHRFWIGVIVAHISVTSCDLYILLRQYRWDWLSLLINALSILVVFFWCGVWSSSTASGEFYKSAAQVYGQLSFWAVFFVSVLINLLPRFVYTTLKTFYKPRDIDIIREYVVKFKLTDDSSDSWSLITDQKYSASASTMVKHDDVEEGSRLSRIRTSREVPGLIQTESLVKTFTQTSSLKE